MRLGSYSCSVKSSTKASNAYRSRKINERHRHRYEVNNKYLARMKKKGLIVSGVNEDLNLVEMIEIDSHRWFIGVQFHPELKSRIVKVHPLFDGFIKASIEFNESSTQI